MPCLILSIDGGGLRGLIPALILKHIEEKVQFANNNSRKLVTYFNLVSGTSTGGLITCGLTLGDQTNTLSTKYSPSFIENVYRENSNRIFPYKGKIGEWWRSLPFSYPWRPQFKRAGLDSVLNEIFQNARISDCITPILIPTYNVETNEPFYFSTRKAFQQRNLNFRLFDVCKATSAGPTYLPAHMLWEPKRMICVDGGVFQNNPTTSALVEVIKYPKLYYGNNDDTLTLDKIFILSIGTGRFNQPIASRHAFKGGRLNWINPIVDIGMWGNSQAVDKHMEEVLKFTSTRQYLRINTRITDKRFADMAISTPEAMDHYTNSFNEDYLNNANVQADLDQWLRDSGIVR
jgi:patatin-like phospholipase/acyl hydrolase